MKIIFSRKGFDSETGGCPSPILPDGRLCYLPVPDGSREVRLKYRDVRWYEHDLGTIVSNLSSGRIRRNSTIHIDPDLDARSLPRKPGWRALYGPRDSIYTHLDSRGVSVGDVFLFFGWFRLAEFHRGRFRYVPDAYDMHVVLGWLQVGRVLEAASCARNRRIWSWAKYHPHLTEGRRDEGYIYAARRFLNLPGTKRRTPGAGVFRHFRPVLCLTAPNSKRSRWRLPEWFYPRSGKDALSYHGDRSRWRVRKGAVYLDTVARGQDFVLDCAWYPEAVPWLGGLLSCHDLELQTPG